MFRRIDKGNLGGACFCGMKSESACITECIKDSFTADKAFDKEAVIALIKIEAGLMSLFKIDKVIYGAVTDKFVLYFTEIHFILCGKSFQSAEIILIPGEYIFGLEFFL